MRIWLGHNKINNLTSNLPSYRRLNIYSSCLVSKLKEHENKFECTRKNPLAILVSHIAISLFNYTLIVNTQFRRKTILSKTILNCQIKGNLAGYQL